VNAPILIVEDDRELQDVLVGHLKGEGYPVTAASDLAEARRLCEGAQHRLVIADLLLGDDIKGGLELIGSVSQGVPFILISGNANREALAEAINCGVSRFFEKPFRLADLSVAVRELLESSQPAKARWEKMVADKELTTREREVFALLMQGYSNKAIADQIQTAERTVKAHLSSVFKKFEVRSRAELLSKLL
jgi:DNA-binding NarL/FixJ family response regulator